MEPDESFGRPFKGHTTRRDLLAGEQSTEDGAPGSEDDLMGWGVSTCRVKDAVAASDAEEGRV